ncbi:GYD domain-containing protein [Ramlibacter sp. MMS24-I3-19]|uniref:GYD domain-containing protein n=1 Tax=Ramlibacter sp. MMS24-I3-19 TaxID=3416606 RepID=UPI003D07B644
MATYIGLATFTEQGMRTVKDTVKRADAAREIGAKFGVQMKNIHWTLGAYDLVVECEAKDDAAMVAYSLAIASAGNVKFQSLRALTRDEMSQVVTKLP